MGKRIIYDERDLDNIGAELIEGVNRAVVAAAFKIRDDARKHYRADATRYKYHTEKSNALAEGIMVGKLRGGTIKIHALGAKSDYHTYKTRFFVGGTKYRVQKKYNGKNIKPYTKGFISELSSLDKSIASGESTLKEFINNALK